MTLLDDSVAEALVSNRIVGRRQSYAADNPIESKAVFIYLKGGVRPLSVVTSMGRHLVALEDARRAHYQPPIIVDNPNYAYSVGAYSGDIYGN